MTYVGAVPTTGDFKLLDSITTSSATTFNLRQGGVAVYPQSANHCIVQLNGVNQVPTSSFNIVNDTIVFASSLSSNDVINQILVLGNVNDIGVPSDDTISTAKIQADAINATKIADDSISDEHLDITAITGQTAITSLADTDKFLVSDASDSGNLKYVEKQYLPSGTLVEIAEANVTSNVGSYFFSNVFSSTYDSYFLDLRKLRFDADSGLQLRFLSNSTTGEFSGAYYQFAFYGLDNAGNEERDTGNGDTKLVLGYSQDGDSSSDGGITGNMYFYNPFANNSSSVNTVGQFAYRDSSNAFNGINFAGNYSGTSARYGFVLFGGQQINQLQATLYGIVK